MKRTLITAALLASFAAMPAAAQPGGPMHDGMGPGMMGGPGMGSGMMEGCHADPYAALKLSSEQRAQLDDIQREFRRTQQKLMSRMHEQEFHMHDLFALAGADEAAARKSFDAMSAAMKDMFEASLEAGKRINAVLTDEQRKQLRRGRP